MNPKYGVISIILFALIIQIAQAYPFKSVYHDDSSVNNIVTPPNFFSIDGQNCTGTFSLYATASNGGAPYTLGNAWYSPDSNMIISANPPYTLSQTCGLQGTYNLGPKNSTSYFYETRTTTTTTASTTHTWQVANYNCSPATSTGTLADVIIYNNTAGTDVFGNHPYAYLLRPYNYCSGVYPTFPSISTLQASILSYMQEYVDGCSSSGSTTLQVDKDHVYDYSCPAASWHAVSIAEVVPFNGQYAGKVNISINSIGISRSCATSCACTLGAYIYLYDTSNGQWQNLGTGIPFSANINLPVTSNPRNYYLVIGTNCPAYSHVSSPAVLTQLSHNYNISISAYQPSVSCGNYSSCTGGTRQRSCTDLNGILPNWIDYDTSGCGGGVLPEQLVDLGFDDYIQNVTWECTLNTPLLCTPGIVPGYFFTVYFPGRTRSYPKDWNVHQLWACDNYSCSPDCCAYADDLMDLQLDETAPVGSRSLKMWYIPPSPAQPLYNITGGHKIVTCGGSMTGKQGYIERQDINSTFFIARNITAYSQYMNLYFQMRRCTDTEWGRNDCFTIPPIPKTYYTFDGNPVVPEGKVRVTFTDTFTGLPVIDEIYRPTSTSWDDPNNAISKQLSGLIFNRTYQISFAVPPDSGDFDSKSYCVHLDNVQIQFRSTILNCTSQCIADYNQDGLNDYTYVTATKKTATECNFGYESFSTKCVPSTIIDCAASKNPSGCCVGTTLYTWNNDTQKWSFLEDSNYCIQLQIAEEQQKNVTGTNPIIKWILNGAGISDSDIDNSGFGFIISTIFLVLIIDIVIAAYITIKTKPKSGGNASWELGLVILGALMLVESLPPFNVFPTFFIVIFIIFIGLVAAEFLGRRVKGG